MSDRALWTCVSYQRTATLPISSAPRGREVAAVCRRSCASDAGGIRETAYEPCVRMASGPSFCRGHRCLNASSIGFVVVRVRIGREWVSVVLMYHPNLALELDFCLCE